MTSLPTSIRAALAAQGGFVTFARFMELALTDPEAGYYTGAELSLGPEGDFTTAPRRVPAFNQAFAGLLAELVDALLCARREGGADVDGHLPLYEIGPGEGDLAAGVLGAWSRDRPDLRDLVGYRLIEVGEGMRRRQEAALRTAREAGWSVQWLPALPRSPGVPPGVGPTGAGIVLTNELLDALPVHRLDVRGTELREAWVALRADGSAAGSRAASPLEEQWASPSSEALEELALLFGTSDPFALRPLTLDGRLEVRPRAFEFLSRAAGAVEEGFVVTVDYGEWMSGPDVPGVEGLQSVPHRESVRSYYRHQRRHSFYDLVGRQDITADVDFRALALHGARAGFDCLVYTGLGPLLRALGAGDELARLRAEAVGSLDKDIEAAALAALVEDGGLGDTFKVMVQVREAACDPAR